MSFVSGLGRAWISIEVPGATRDRLLSTYVVYSPDRLPQVPQDVADLNWLERAPAHPTGFMATAFESATRDLTRTEVTALLGDCGGAPEDLQRFVVSGLRDRLRSATDCYFDLGDVSVEVEGGRLLHLVSDSQWVFHRLLFLADDGGQAVVGTAYPAGFSLDPEEATYWEDEGYRYYRVADTFAEFAWRWFMDNDVFWTITPAWSLRREGRKMALLPTWCSSRSRRARWSRIASTLVCARPTCPSPRSPGWRPSVLAGPISARVTSGGMVDPDGNEFDVLRPPARDELPPGFDALGRRITGPATRGR